jgi:UDP-N-acetyl-D-mannosaminuronic acid dehydrogenase
LEQRIGTIGLGHVGLPLLAALANVGCTVVGLDTDQRKVDFLKRTLESDIYEPGVTDVLRRYAHNISFTTSHVELMERCDTIFVTVGTPLRPDNGPDTTVVDEVAATIGERLRPGQVVVFKSTLPPGHTRKAAALMESVSGLKAGEEFFVAFCPERIAEGMALHEFHAIPKIVGGINDESTERAARVVAMLGGKVLRVSCPEVAEVAKLVDNSYRLVNIAFASEVGLICEGLGIDATEVRLACNDGYKRTTLFQAGLGAGGYCLTKDPQVFAHHAEERDIEASVITSGIRASRSATLRPALVASGFVRDSAITQPKFALLGLAFKGFPETDDARESPAMDIYRALQREFPQAEFALHDPLIKEFAGRPVCTTLSECIRGAHVVMFLTNHRALLNVDVRDVLCGTARPLLLVDCWHNVVNLADARTDGVRVFRIGDGSL